MSSTIGSTAFESNIGNQNKISWVKLTSIETTCIISSPNPMLDHLIELSRWDDSNEWSNIGFCEEIHIVEN